MALGTEFARNLWAGIGPLQLGIVLVLSTKNVMLKHRQLSYVEYHHAPESKTF